SPHGVRGTLDLAAPVGAAAAVCVWAVPTMPVRPNVRVMATRPRTRFLMGTISFLARGSYNNARRTIGIRLSTLRRFTAALGFGLWALGFGPRAQSPEPKAESPKPRAQSQLVSSSRW